MDLYPFSTAIILTDDIFLAYGGQTGSSTPAMRDAAYLMAEQQMTSHLGTVLLPVWLTGSAQYFGGNGYLITQYGYVSQMGEVVAQDRNGNELFRLTGTNAYAYIQNDTFGYIWVKGMCNHWPGNEPVNFSWSYEAGLPTGTASMPTMLMALSGAAQLVLNELFVVPMNESTGDVGVTEYTSIGYSEKRKKWKNTAFGNSPKAAWVARMAEMSVKKARRAITLGRL